MTKALSLLTFRAWFKPKDTAPQLIQRFDFKTLAVLYAAFSAMNIVATQSPISVPIYVSILGYLLAPVVFVLIAKWVTKKSWLALLEIGLLGAIVITPLSLLSNLPIVSPAPDGSNLALLSILGLLVYLPLNIWIIAIQLRLYSTMLGTRKRTVFAIVIAAAAILIGINLLLFQLTPQV